MQFLSASLISFSPSDYLHNFTKTQYLKKKNKVKSSFTPHIFFNPGPQFCVPLLLKLLATMSQFLCHWTVFGYITSLRLFLLRSPNTFTLPVSSIFVLFFNNISATFIKQYYNFLFSPGLPNTEFSCFSFHLSFILFADASSTFSSQNDGILQGSHQRSIPSSKYLLLLDIFIQPYKTIISTPN